MDYAAGVTKEMTSGWYLIYSWQYEYQPQQDQGVSAMVVGYPTYPGDQGSEERPSTFTIET